MATVGFMTWLAWSLIGLIGGYMTGNLKGAGPVVTGLSVIVGLAGALAGGWLLIEYAGSSDRMQYLSLLSSAALCAVALWIFGLFKLGDR